MGPSHSGRLWIGGHVPHPYIFGAILEFMHSWWCIVFPHGGCQMIKRRGTNHLALGDPLRQWSAGGGAVVDVGEPLYVVEMGF